MNACLCRDSAHLELSNNVAGTGKTKAADYILSNPDVFGVRSCVKLGAYNVGRAGNKLTLPYYMGFLLTEV